MKRDDEPPEREVDKVPGPAAVTRDVPDIPPRLGAADKPRARGTDSDAEDDYNPPEGLIDELAKQCTREVMERVCRYAARRLSGARKVSATDYAAQELAQDAIDDTAEGRAPWDPAVLPLDRHLFNLVKRRTSANRKREERLPHVSIDVTTMDGRSLVRDEMERAMRAQRPDEDAAAYARSVVDELRRRAQADADVLALIDAKADDRTSRADAMAVTGFSEQRYRAALRRLNRMVDELGIELQLIRDRRERK